MTGAMVVSLYAPFESQSQAYSTISPSGSEEPEASNSIRSSVRGSTTRRVPLEDRAFQANEATGGALEMVRVLVTESVSPSLSVTTSVTAIVPLSEKRCEGLRCVEDEPSPKSQYQLLIDPSGSDDESVN